MIPGRVRSGGAGWAGGRFIWTALLVLFLLPLLLLLSLLLLFSSSTKGGPPLNMGATGAKFEKTSEPSLKRLLVVWLFCFFITFVIRFLYRLV